jgi:hypothetical protein
MEKMKGGVGELNLLNISLELSENSEMYCSQCWWRKRAGKRVEGLVHMTRSFYSKFVTDNLTKGELL